MANRKDRRAQAAQSRAGARENVDPDLCVCCNAQKVMRHLVNETVRAGDGQLVAFHRDDDDRAIAEFGVLRLEMDLNTARFDIYALGESVAWFTPDHFEWDRRTRPWVYTLASIRMQLDESFGPQDIGEHVVH